MKHDIESYVITINRKGHQSTAPQTVTSAIPRMEPSVHESDSCCFHELQDVTAPLPGIIVDLKVKVGDKVSEGYELAVLEAMKMENSILSPSSGTVLSLNVSLGDSVSEGTILMIID